MSEKFGRSRFANQPTDGEQTEQSTRDKPSTLFSTRLDYRPNDSWIQSYRILSQFSHSKHMKQNIRPGTPCFLLFVFVGLKTSNPETTKTQKTKTQKTKTKHPKNRPKTTKDTAKKQKHPKNKPKTPKQHTTKAPQKPTKQTKTKTNSCFPPGRGRAQDHSGRPTSPASPSPGPIVAETYAPKDPARVPWFCCFFVVIGFDFFNLLFIFLRLVIKVVLLLMFSLQLHFLKGTENLSKHPNLYLLWMLRGLTFRNVLFLGGFLSKS